MPHVLSFGEILIRQQSVGDSFFGNQENLLRIYPGGSEANVACSLGQMGTPVQYASAFPNNKLSEEILAVLNGHQVDTSKCLQIGDRIGSYFLLSANGLTKGEVIYDRKYSSFSQLKADDLDFDVLFEDVDWLHWTALTPALNQEMADVMLKVLQAASERNIYISVDLNYRNRLWQYGKDPLEIMPDLLAYCHVIMGNIWAAHTMVGIAVPEGLDRNTEKEVLVEAATVSAAALFEKYARLEHIANTFRFMDNPTHNLFFGTYHSRTENAVSQTYETNAIVDRIGSGDAFMAGLIHALRKTQQAQEIIDIATGAGYEKLFVEGDFGNGKY